MRIRLKKPIYPVSQELENYLREHGRWLGAQLNHKDLFHYRSSIALQDKSDNDTLWETLIFDEADQQFIYPSLKEIYAHLKVNGDLSVMGHLRIDRLDLCTFGNTKPIRVRIVNELNDLFDYFYIKQADASRIYGMELEHSLSPNKINYLVWGNTLVEEHIPGIPGDQFIAEYLPKATFNPKRLAKEFVKFNERCLVQLLADMRDDNFVVEIVQDFDEVHFRMRAIDFDQQCFEGSRSLYLPQFFRENFPIIKLGLKSISPQLELQYQKEERTRMAKRAQSEHKKLKELLGAMRTDTLSTPENIQCLSQELAELYQDNIFNVCKNSGDIVKTSISLLFKYPLRKRKVPKLAQA
ncbi:MAG: hypothetical protein JXQ96_12055 [Cyclobacteriaceae bacterium]